MDMHSETRFYEYHDNGVRFRKSCGADNFYGDLAQPHGTRGDLLSKTPCAMWAKIIVKNGAGLRSTLELFDNS